jgi:tripeptide aminopeptidase
MASVAESLASLLKQPEVCAGLEWFRKEKAWITEQHLALCRIPAPTFFEQQRAEWVAARFRSLGWEAKLDRAGNVIATLPGRRDSDAVAVTAHLDTVLAPRNPDDIRVMGDGRILGPGVSDNGAGLTALLALAAVWSSCSPLAGVAPVLIANVGEEGEGNLCGMRYLCRAKGTRYRAFLVLDGPNSEHVTWRALASRRFEVTLTGPGGHSWNDHGIGNPVHALSRAITWFTEQAQELERQAGEPRSSFNFGIFQGGTSINSIPAEARAKVDLRSERQDRMDLLARLLAATVEKAVAWENSRSTAERGAGGRVAARVKEIGSRPGGGLAEGEPLLETLLAVNAHLGIRTQLDCSSTDANIPLSLGLPAVSIGAGGQGGGAAHSVGVVFAGGSRNRASAGVSGDLPARFQRRKNPG